MKKKKYITFAQRLALVLEYGTLTQITNRDYCERFAHCTKENTTPDFLYELQELSNEPEKHIGYKWTAKDKYKRVITAHEVLQRTKNINDFVGLVYIGIVDDIQELAVPQEEIKL